MNMSYLVMVMLIRKISSISNGKSRKIKFPNLWIMPIMFIGMIMEDYLRPDGYTYSMLLSLSIFGISGLFLGLIRGITLKYQEEDDNEIYYKESYISLMIYILVIVVKWYLKFIGGADQVIFGGGLVFFACGSLIGRCFYISYKYLHFNRKRI